MYWAKDEGGDFRVFNPAMYERAYRRLEVENDLRRAIEQEEFVVHYQPIVDLQTGEPWGMEALVRWEHPERGSGAFRVRARRRGERPGDTDGGAGLEGVLRAAKEWQEGNPRTPPLVMSVNLSAIAASRSGLADTVERVLGETGLRGAALHWTSRRQST